MAFKARTLFLCSNSFGFGGNKNPIVLFTRYFCGLDNFLPTHVQLFLRCIVQPLIGRGAEMTLTHIRSPICPIHKLRKLAMTIAPNKP